MKKLMPWVTLVAVAVLSSSTLQAQSIPEKKADAKQASSKDAQQTNIGGDWQGTVKTLGPATRLVLRVARTGKGGWSAQLWDVDDSPEATPVTSITVQDSTLKFSIDSDQATYEGKLSADGKTITGTWVQGKDSPRPVVFQRATKETAWPLPDPNWGHQLAKVDPKIFDAYAGRYQLTPAAVITVQREGDHLYIQLTGQPRFEVFPFSQKDYFLRVVRAEIGFETDSHGAVTGLVLHQNARELPAKRIVAPTPADITARCAGIDTMMAAEFAKHPSASVTVGVVAGKDLIWTKSYGNADMENKIPADKDTIYRIGSITKMFTALMLEQLADAGKVHLSDPVEKYFPEIKLVQVRFPDAPPITLVQLAKHTSGMDREPADMEKYLQGPVNEWEKTLIAALPHTGYSVEPGTQFSYSNIGYAVLGAALGRAAGERYTDYVPKHIFQPLGMTHTTLDFSADMLPHLSKGYTVEPSGKADASDSQREHQNGRGYKVPNGAIYTTVGDLGRFASFVMGQGPESVLKASVLEKNLQESAAQADFSLGSGYTLGGQVTRRDNYIAFGHGGGVSGYQAGLEINRDTHVAVIVLANEIGGGFDTNGMALKALDALSK
ncbi:MAG TPA: serine hydrolase [Candidatus Angelobacter sp.]